ncbi:MAG: hypothetical protein VCD66_02905 [Alphaproteobacteria bacterium]
MLTPTLSYRLRRRLGTAWCAPLLTQAARRGAAPLAARLLANQVRFVGGAGGTGREVVRLLLLCKSGFTEDMAAAFDTEAGVRLLALDRILTKAIFAAFLPLEVDDNNYRSAGAEYDGAKQALREFWAALWPRFRAAVRLDAVLTGNFAYCAEQEMAAAAEGLGTPFITVQKECLKTPGLEPFYGALYRERRQAFAGRLVCNYNRIERGLQLANAITGEAGNVLTGMPRLDAVHRWRAGFGDRPRSLGAVPRAVFMSFSERTGAPMMPRKGALRYEALDAEYAGVGFNRLAGEVHRAAVETARRAPGAEIVIKAKDDARALAALRTSFGAGFTPPANLSIVSGGDPFELITTADVVVGFNSTALFEALAAAVPVIVPEFAEAADPAIRPYVIDLAGAARHAASAEELIEGVLDHLAPGNGGGAGRALPTILSPAAAQVLDHWLGNADGGAGRRVADAVLATVAAARNPAP